MTGPRIIFIPGAEQRVAVQYISIDTGAEFVPVFIAEGGLRAFILGHFILQGRQPGTQLLLVPGAVPIPACKVVTARALQVELIIQRVRLIIILVLRFSRVERRGRQNLSHNRTLEPLAGLQRSLGGFSQGTLFLAMHKD
ncbi:hypothetical protein D3C75_1053700 [compost metagenome]